MKMLRTLILIMAISVNANQVFAKLYTDDILQQAPFNVKDANKRAEIFALARDLNLTLDPYLHGEVYAKVPYTDQQQGEIVADLITLTNKHFAHKKPSADKFYISTAGAPGVGKSIFFEQLMQQESNKFNNVVYVDPDRQSLQFMDAYWKLADTQGGEIAYDTYRDGSNYICNLQLIWAAYNSYNIAHGTTGTNERVGKSILPTLKKLGYKIDMRALFASATARKGSLLYRIQVQNFFQVTEADAKGKVAPMYDRLVDAYLKYADQVTIYYNNGDFWLNKTAYDSAKDLRKFAFFDRSKDALPVILKHNEDVIEMLQQDVKQELADPAKQAAVIAMFKSWPREQ